MCNKLRYGGVNMSQQEVYNRMYADLQRAQQENLELRKQIVQQTNDYERVVKKYQNLQSAYFVLQQNVMELKVLHTDLMQYHTNFTDYLNKLTGDK